MFGKKKDGTSSPTAAPKGAAGSGADAEAGELILEQLFMEERPQTKTSKFAALAEEAEFVDAKPAAASKPEPKQPKSASKQADEKTKRPGMLSGLFAKRPATAKPAMKKTAVPAAAPIEVLDLGEGPTEGLSLDIHSEASIAVEPAAPVEPAAAEKPAKASKPAKPAKPAKAKAEKVPKPKRRRGGRDVFLSAQISGDRSVYWKLSAQGIEPLEALPAGVHALSFSKEDLRFEVETRVSHTAAESLVLQDVGDAVHVLNRSKDLRAVYATLRSRIEGLPHRLGPGQLVLDRLVRERAPEADALIVGVELKDHSGREALLILYYLSATGRSSEPQISVYPDNREFLLSQFAATHQASRENAQVLLLDHTALLDASRGAEFYPNEPHVAGIPLRKVWSHAATVGVLVAAVSMGWAYQNFTENGQARVAHTRVQSAVDLAQKTASGLLSSSPRALAQGLALDVSQVLKRSHELWVPGSRVALTADGTGVDYRVTLPLLDTQSKALKAGIATVKMPAVEALLHLQTPADCERGTLNFSGTFNEAQLNFRCEAAPHPLDRYRGG